MPGYVRAKALHKLKAGRDFSDMLSKELIHVSKNSLLKQRRR